MGAGASTFLVGDSGFSGACVTQLSATAATAMLRGGSGKQSSYFGRRVKKRDRLAGREKETESNGKGEHVCDSFVLKGIPERVRIGVVYSTPLGFAWRLSYHRTLGQVIHFGT